MGNNRIGTSEPGKHTEGPWIRRDNQDYAEIIGCGHVVAMVAREADADLITAAPTMLETLRDMEHAFSNAGEPGCDIEQGPFADYALELIRKAISKATGTP